MTPNIRMEDTACKRRLACSQLAPHAGRLTSSGLFIRWISNGLFRMFIVDVPGMVLSWLGRQGTRAVAALVVIGIALPSIGAILKP